MPGIGDILRELDEFFALLGDWISWAYQWFREMVLQFPDAALTHERLYDLAGAYERTARLYMDHFAEVQSYVADLNAWRGDGSAQLARDALNAYQQDTIAMADATYTLHRGVHSKALEIESAVYMGVVNLILLGIALIQAIVFVWTGVGTAIGMAQAAGARVTIGLVMRNLANVLWQQTIRAGIRKFFERGVLRSMGSLALQGGLISGAFTAGTRGGIMLLQDLEGHDPFGEEGALAQYGWDILDSTITGVIGGPLTFGMTSPIVGSLAFGAGQTVDNLFQIARGDMEFSWANVFSGLTPAALLGEVVTDGGGFDRRSLSQQWANADVRLGTNNLFSPSRLGSGADLPSLADAGSSTVAGHPDTGLVDTFRPADTSTHLSETIGSAPQTGTAQTGTPQTSAPQTGAPQTGAPQTGTPQTGAPQTGAPQTGAPRDAASSAPPAEAAPTHSDGARDGVVRDSPPPGGPPPDGTPLRDTPPSDGTPARDGDARTDVTAGHHTPPPDGTPARDGDARTDVTTDHGGPPPDRTSAVDRDSASSTVGSRPDGPAADGGPPPGDRPSTVEDSRSDVDRGDAATQPAASTHAADTTSSREDGRWQEARQRYEQHYSRAVAEEFGPRDGEAATPRRAPELTPELIQRAMATSPESLNAYGTRLRSFLEQHFTRDVDGVRRPLDQAGIDATLRELRGDSPTGPRSGPTPDQRGDSETADGPSEPGVRPEGDGPDVQAWAEDAVERFRIDDSDIDGIVSSLSSVQRPSGAVGFSRPEITQVKRHLMVDEHRLRDEETGGRVTRRFPADPDIVEAWIRLSDGRHLPEDLVLLEHELVESSILRANPDATVEQAHHYASRMHPWERAVPPSTRENIDGFGVRPDGDSGRLREGPGEQSGSGVRVRDGRVDGPTPADRQAVGAGEPSGRQPRQELLGGVPQDPPRQATPGSVADSRGLPGVADPPGDRVARDEADVGDVETGGPSRPEIPRQTGGRDEAYSDDTPRWSADDLTPTGARGTGVRVELFVDAHGVLHTVGDAVGTFRDNRGFLHDAIGFVSDPNKPPRPGVDGPNDPGDRRVIPTDGDSATAEAVRQATIARDAAAAAKVAVWDLEVQPIAEALRRAGLTVDRSTFGGAKFLKALSEATHKLTPAELILAEDAARRYAAASANLVAASEHLGTVGGAHAVTIVYPDGRLVSGGDGTHAPQGTFDRVIFVEHPRPLVVIIEEKGAGSPIGTRIVPDPANPSAVLNAEQASPEYIRDLLASDPRLAEALDADPALREAMQRAVAAGQIESVVVRTAADGVVSWTDYRLDPQRLQPETIVLSEAAAARGPASPVSPEVALAQAAVRVPAITEAIHDTASSAGGILTRDHQPTADPEMLRQRFAEAVNESPAGRPLVEVAQHVVTPRYAVELPFDGWAGQAQQVITGLAERGFEPAGPISDWATPARAGDQGGVTTVWRDSSGQQFELRLEVQGGRPEVPPGVDGIELPRSGDPYAWSGSPDPAQLLALPLIAGPAAVDAVVATARPVQAGLDLSGDRRGGEIADALVPEPGVWKLALHALPNGEVVVGQHRMSAADLAEGLTALRRDGRLPADVELRLIACYAGSGHPPPAAVIAQGLGQVVTGAVEKVWVFDDGLTVVASQEPSGAVHPTDPASDAWRSYGRYGQEIDTPWRATELIDRPDGAHTASHDPLGSHRDEQGLLHWPGDPEHSWRGPDQRLHHLQDPPGTYREGSGFELFDGATRAYLPDPLLQQPVAHHAAELGPVHRYPAPSSPDPALDAPRAAAREVLALRYGMTAADIVLDGVPTGLGAHAVVGFDSVHHRLVVVETQNPSGTSHVLPDGTTTERGTPEYLRDILRNSRDLHQSLAADPARLTELHYALTRGDLTVEYRRVEVDVDGSVWTRALDLSRVEPSALLDGVAESLPRPPAGPDPHGQQRLHDAAQRLSALFTGPDTRAGGIAGITLDVAATRATPTGVVVEVQPVRGRPYSLRIEGGPGDSPFTVTVDQATQSYTLRISDLASARLDQAGLDRLLTRAVGHAHAEVAVDRSSAFARRLGFHGGRLVRDDALVFDAVPDRHLRPSHRDLTDLGEFEMLAWMHRGSSGPNVSILEFEIRRFIDEHALREGLPGAEERLRLAKARLSEPAARLLDDHRAWWRDADPAAAGIRRSLLAEKPPGIAEIGPVARTGDAHILVEPAGWHKAGKSSISVIVRSGPAHPEPGRPDVLVERGAITVRKTILGKHFVLEVARDAFGPDGTVDARFTTTPQGDWAAAQWARLRADVDAAIAETVRVMAVRAPELPYARFLERLLYRLPALTSAGVVSTVALIGSLVVVASRNITGSLVDMATRGWLTRVRAISAAEAQHARALAQLPGRHYDSPPELVATHALDSADGLATRVGEPTLVQRPKAPNPWPVNDPAVRNDDAAQALRARISREIEEVGRDVRDEHRQRRRQPPAIGQGPVPKLTDRADLRAVTKWYLPGGSDKFLIVVERSGPRYVTPHHKAIQVLAVDKTKAPGTIDVVRTNSFTQLHVPPELAAADPATLRAAVRQALEKVAHDQYDVGRDEPDFRAHSERASWELLFQGPPTVGSAAALVDWRYGVGLGVSAVSSAIVRTLANWVHGVRLQILIDRRDFDNYDHSLRRSFRGRQMITGYVDGLLVNAERVAAHLADALAGGPGTASARPHPSTLPVSQLGPAEVAVRLHGARQAVEAAVRQVNDAHDINTGMTRLVDTLRHHPEREAFALVTDTPRGSGPHPDLVYRSDQAGIRYDARVQIHFTEFKDGDHRTITTDDVGIRRRGRFNLLVNVNADPAEITRALTHAMDVILYDREHRVPPLRRLYEDVLPGAISLVAAIPIGIFTTMAVGPIAGLAAFGLAAVPAVGHLGARWVERLHRMQMNDTELNNYLSADRSQPTDYPPQFIRDRLAQQRSTVELAERLTRELEHELAARPDTAAAVADLHSHLGEIPPPTDQLVTDLIDAVTQLIKADQARPSPAFPPDVRVSPVLRTTDTIRLEFSGARLELLSVELRPGVTDGAPVLGRRVDSDVAYVLRVDPTRPLDELAHEVRDWLIRRVESARAEPDGLVSQRARMTNLVPAAGLVLGDAVRLALMATAGIHGLPAPALTTPRLYNEIGWATHALTGSGSKTMTDRSLDAHQAADDIARREQYRRYFFHATQEQLATIAEDSAHLLDRTRLVHERLWHLTQIADQLPVDLRPDALRDGRLAGLFPDPATVTPALVRGTPYRWGGDAPEVPHVGPAAALQFAGAALDRSTGALSIEPAETGSASAGTNHWIIETATQARVGLVQIRSAEQWFFEGAAREVIDRHPWHRLAVPDPIAIGVARDPDTVQPAIDPDAIGDGAVVLLDTAPTGRGLDELIRAVGESGPRGRAAALRELMSAVRNIGGALAELHHHPDPGGVTDRTPYLARYATALAIAREWADDGVIRQRWGLEPDLAGRFAKLYEAMLREPGRAALVHGDLTPARLFPDSATGRVTMLDVQALIDSVDGRDRPVGVAAVDVARFLHTMAASARAADLTALLPELRREFIEAYRVGAAPWLDSGAALSRDAVAFFRAVELVMDIHATYRRLTEDSSLVHRSTMEDFEYRTLAQVEELREIVHGIDVVLTPPSLEPVYENPGHHDPSGGPNPYNPIKAVLPPDAGQQFANSIEIDGVRWTKVGTGRGAVYYRYFNDANNNWHWSGSSIGVTARGVPVPIPEDEIPIEIRRMR